MPMGRSPPFDRKQVGKKIVAQTDEVLAGAKWVKCKVNRHGFASLRNQGLEVSAEADSIDLSPLTPFSERGLRERGSIRHREILEPPTITKTRIESSRSSSRLAAKPQPWEATTRCRNPCKPTGHSSRLDARGRRSELEVEMIPAPTSFWHTAGSRPCLPKSFIEFPELEVSRTPPSQSPDVPTIAEAAARLTARIVTADCSYLVDVELERENDGRTHPHPICREERDWLNFGDLRSWRLCLNRRWTPIEVVSVSTRTTARPVYNVEGPRPTTNLPNR